MSDVLDTFLEEYTFIDFDDVNAVGMDVTKMIMGGNQVYSLTMVFVKFDESFEKNLGGFIQRTGIYGESIAEVANKLDLVFGSGLYSHLNVLTEGHCYGEDGAVEYEFDWEDYQSGEPLPEPVGVN